MEKKKFKISYTYDPLNRLTAAAVEGEKERHYDYDRAGNLIAISSDPPQKGGEPAAGPEQPAGGKEADRGGRDEEEAADERFGALEEKYRRYSDEAQAGTISPEQFQEKINTLRFQDDGGAWWQLRSDGVWLKWDGAAWLEAEPSAEAKKS